MTTNHKIHNVKPPASLIDFPHDKGTWSSVDAVTDKWSYYIKKTTLVCEITLTYADSTKSKIIDFEKDLF